MDKLTCLRGVVDRLVAVITFRGPEWPDDNTLWTVEAVHSCEAGESYAKRVTTTRQNLLVERFGSYQGGVGSPDRTSWRSVGDGSAALLEVAKNGDLMLRQEDYDGSESGTWKGSTEPHRLCGLDDIVKMEFKTTSGWRGECYPERVYKVGAEDKYPRPDESQWLVVMHRSTGAVTIEREFPF